MYLSSSYMQDINPIPSLIPKKWRLAYYLSIWLLVFVVGISVGFFVYNILLERKIEAEKTQITEIQKNIDEISRDRRVILTKIEKSGTIRPSIDLKGIVADFYSAASTDDVRLKGFSIANDVISTSLTSTKSAGISHPDAAGTIIKMMQKYATWNQWRFALEPITTIAWDPKSRTTSIQFKVVPLPQTPVTLSK